MTLRFNFFFVDNDKEKAMCIRIFLFLLTAAYLCRMKYVTSIISIVYEGGE